jgi:hypothetical protein
MLLLCLARAVSYDTGYSRQEVIDLLRTVRWHKGWCGTHPNKYDLIPCDEEGTAEMDCDDDGEPLICTAVRPTTWAIVKLGGLSDGSE